MTQTISTPFTDWRAPGSTDPPIDAVVVGSGYGGSVAALRLVQQGKRIVVLERGSEYLPGEFPNDIGQLPKYQRVQSPRGSIGSHAGLFDWHVGRGVTSLVANGLGGGSLINAGVMMRPDREVFAQPEWPAEIRYGFDARSCDPGEEQGLGLDAAFVRANNVLGGVDYKNRPNTKTGEEWISSKAAAFDRIREIVKADAEMQKDLRPTQATRVAIDLARCTRCGDCFSGCNVAGAKKTLRTTYLAEARRAGAILVTRCLVYSLQRERDEWVLTVLPTERAADGRRLSDAVKLHGMKLRASLVVIAAGTFGSTELLQRSEQKFGNQTFKLSPALGSRFSANGDSVSALVERGVPRKTGAAHGEADMSIAVEALGHGANTPIEGAADVGPTITTTLDLRGRRALNERLVIQEGCVPGAFVRLYEEVLATAWVTRHLGERWRDPPAEPKVATDPLAATRYMARHTQLLLAMGHDGSTGRIDWHPEMDGSAPYWVRPQDAKTWKRQQEVFDLIERATGAVHLHTPMWRPLPEKAASMFTGPPADPIVLTVHPLGGCPMGDHFEESVVNHLGQVWRAEHDPWPDLYVLDGSIIPTSLGCNPLWTIAAIAERAMAHYAKRPTTPSKGAVWAGPSGKPASSPAPRHSESKKRSATPPFGVCISERLLWRPLLACASQTDALREADRSTRRRGALALPGALGDALRDASGSCTAVEGDLLVHMRHEDCIGVWAKAKHPFEDVRGELRLMNPQNSQNPRSPLNPQNPQEPPRRVEYRIAGGEVDLLSCEPRVFGWGRLVRLERWLRCLVTWWLMRGWRDWKQREVKFTWKGVVSMARLLWQAAEQRTMHYDLKLELSRVANAATTPPAKLVLRAEKNVRYGATWREIFVHARSRHRRDGTRPADLRRSYLEQLTEPRVALAVPGTLRALLQKWQPAWLPAWLGGCTWARYEFDLRWAGRNAPLRLEKGGDTSAGMLALAAYPALVARHALLTRLLDFRLPDYSGVPVIDDASAEDVSLRKVPNGRPVVFPEEIPLLVRRGRSSSDDGTEEVRNLRLRLWRYRRTQADGTPTGPEIANGRWCGRPVRIAKSVLLMHAFGMSGYSFTFKTTRSNFAEHLYQQGYEVWILDSRLSPRTKASLEPGTLDQVGLIDVPKAVDYILDALRAQDHDGPNPPLQIFSFAHCVGAAGMLMALLSGNLSHAVEASVASKTIDGKLPLMPKIAGLVCSQVHPFIVGSNSSQSKTWLPTLLRNMYARRRVPLAVRTASATFIESLADRLFAAMPVPQGQRCPNEGETTRRHDDDCATCRRIRFLDGELFKHRNLNRRTHAELPKLFGEANVRLFAHAAKFVEYERLVTEDGFNVYATDDAIGRFLAMPLRFVHGDLNELFDKESAVRSASQFERIHPAWASAYSVTGASDGRGVAEIIEGYGHLDVLIGRLASRTAKMPTNGAAGLKPARSVYTRMSALFDEVLTQSGLPLPDCKPESHLCARAPKAGPWIGPVVRVNGKREVGVAFVIDDTTTEAAPTRGVQASAIVHVAGQDARLEALRVRNYFVPLPARDGFAPAHAPLTGEPRPDRQRFIGLQVAYGTIEIPPDATSMAIECMSHPDATGRRPDWKQGDRAKAIVKNESAARAAYGSTAALGRSMTQPPAGQSPSLSGPVVPPKSLTAPDEFEDRNSARSVDLEELRTAIQFAEAQASEELVRADRPIPTTLSLVRREALTGMERWARLRAQALADPGDSDEVLIALGGCRYPGFRFDRERGDETFKRLLTRMRKPYRIDPSMLLMLGDQIYADATAGFIDPLSSLERYFHRHEKAFNSRWLRKLLAQLPTAIVVDDHEIIDAYPLGKPLFRGERSRQFYAGARERRALRCALQAIEGFQMLHLPPSAREGWYRFELGAVRFFVMDTRCWRTRATASTEAAWIAFDAWLADGASGTALHCVVTASVVCPGLVPGNDPANPGPRDTMQAFEGERRCLLDRLVRNVPRRFVLISGDYHVSFAGELWLDNDVVGACIVAPPFYAPLPYANAEPCDLWLDEPIALPGGGVLTVRGVDPRPAPVRGSGYGLLNFQRVGAAWKVAFRTELRDFDTTGTWESSPWNVVTLAHPSVGLATPPMAEATHA